jgi:hypothetical protein
VRDDVGVRKGDNQLYRLTVLQPRRQSGGPLPDAVNPCLHSSQLVPRCAHYNARHRNHIQNGPRGCRGPTIAQGSKTKPTNRFSATQSKQIEGQSDTKVGQQFVHPGPHREGPASSSFVSESRPGGFFHAPPYGLTSSRPGSPNRD